MSKLSKSLTTLARQAGGSFKTMADRTKIASRMAENISKRTLQNEMAALRAIFNVAGRSKLADPAHERLSNSALGLSGACRDGTKVAISDERYQAVFSVIKNQGESVAAAVQLARCLGLRTEDAAG